MAVSISESIKDQLLLYKELPTALEILMAGGYYQILEAVISKVCRDVRETSKEDKKSD